MKLWTRTWFHMQRFLPELYYFGLVSFLQVIGGQGFFYVFPNYTEHLGLLALCLQKWNKKICILCMWAGFGFSNLQ